VRRLAFALALLVPTLAAAQSLPNGVPGTQGIYYGYNPGYGFGSGNWNGFFTAKQDWIGLSPMTVETLPACGASNQYYSAVVTDATSPTYLGALTGAGAVVVPVFCNGTIWVAH
jgi:hypothetical protein